MIFVTVGLHTQPFDRLIQAMDNIAATTDEKVIMQIGHAAYLPRHAQHFRFTTSDEMLGWYRTARVVVAHGASSTLEVLRMQKPLVSVPRQAKYREHLNDHQVDFVRTMERRGLVRAVYEMETLEEALAGIEPPPTCVDDARKRMLIETLQEYLHSVEEARP